MRVQCFVYFKKKGWQMDKFDEAKNGYEKFKGEDFREFQKEAIEFIVESKKKIVVACLPTGAGKSLIGTISANLSGGGIYLVHSKPLQVQLQNDFPELPIMWGRGNYECLKSGGELSCSDCTSSGSNPCPNKAGKCPYLTAKAIARNSFIKVLNYDYWITEVNYVGSFGGQDFIVVDEADSLEYIISKFIDLEFSEGLMKYLGMPYPKYKTTSSEHSLEDWRKWAKFALQRIIFKIRDLDRANNDLDPDPALLKRREKLTGLKRKLEMFVDNVDESWIYDEVVRGESKSISFKPRWVNVKLAEKYIWSHAKKFVLMSATFPPLPVLAKQLGVNITDMEYREFKSTFPVSNRPVEFMPIANMVYSEMDDEIPKAIECIKMLMDRHKNEKGLIHTVSYKLAREVMGIGDSRLVTHNGEDKIRAIEDFKNSDKPLIMVSPSSERGISLDGEKCRWIVWMKAPYLNLKDKMVSARLYKSSIGNLWYKSNAIMTVVQGCGRAVRSNQDRAVSYIIDKQIIKLITENPRLVPGWFREAIW